MNKQDKEIIPGGYITTDGTKITPKVNGVNIELLPGRAYNICVEKNTRNSEVDPRIYLKRAPDITFPHKSIYSEDDRAYIEQILAMDKTGIFPNLGIFFHGVRGSSKTWTMKTIAIESGKPIIWANPDVSYADMTTLLSSYPGKEGVVILFDEFERFPAGKQLLSFLDGELATFRKMCIFTVNEIMKVNREDGENLFDRPSRLFFIWKKDKLGDLETFNTIQQYPSIANQNQLMRFINEAFTVKTKDIINSYLKAVDALKLTKFEDQVALAKRMSFGLNNIDKFSDVKMGDTFGMSTTFGETYKKIQKINPALGEKSFLNGLSAYLDSIMSDNDEEGNTKKLRQKFEEASEPLPDFTELIAELSTLTET